MSRPSDGMTLDELREEFDWISDFQSRMAERIRGDADVHNLVDYVAKLESDKTKLEGLVLDALAFALACVWHLNELAGYERMEPSAPTTKTFASLLQRAKELGVPDA